MTEGQGRVDHIHEARESLVRMWKLENTHTTGKTMEWGLDALIHAVLALVEEQALANRLEVFKHTQHKKPNEVQELLQRLNIEDQG